MKTQIHDLFIERLHAQFPQNIVEQIFRGFSNEKRPVIRINTLKTNTQEMMSFFREKNIQFERIPFLPDALIIKNKKERDFEDMEIYTQGKIYFQGISSQIPVLFLAPKAGEKVLDVSAAPGSKTTQIGIMMRNTGEILANELDAIRLERMKYNLEKQGISIAETRLGDGSVLGNEYPEAFDKVLLDAPCSAEGRINMKEIRTFKFWSEKNIKENSQLQKRLFLSAYKALKKGGTLVYSTCTLAPEENEKIVDWALGRFEDLSVKKISLDFKYLLPIVTQFRESTFHPQVKNCLKAAPSDVSEGFFIACFEKK